MVGISLVFKKYEKHLCFLENCSLRSALDAYKHPSNCPLFATLTIQRLSLVHYSFVVLQLLFGPQILLALTTTWKLSVIEVVYVVLVVFHTPNC